MFNQEKAFSGSLTERFERKGHLILSITPRDYTQVMY